MNATGGREGRRMDEGERIRRYLLGQLAAAEEERLEERLVGGEAPLLQGLEAVEDDLVEDYLRGDLSGRDRRGFERHFLISPEHRRHLELARLVRGRFVEGPTRRSPWRTVPAGLAAAVVVLLAAGFVVWSVRPRVERAPSSARLSPTPPPGLESPVQRLHAPEGRRRMALDLKPRQVMGGRRPAVRLGPESEILDVTLWLESEGRQRYTAALTRDGRELMTWSDLESEPSGDDTRLGIEIPAPVLEPGAYEIVVRGAGGAGGEKRRYYFDVLRDAVPPR
jgi:hypothetical protein